MESVWVVKSGYFNDHVQDYILNNKKDIFIIFYNLVYVSFLRKCKLKTGSNMLEATIFKYKPFAYCLHLGRLLVVV